MPIDVIVVVPVTSKKLPSFPSVKEVAEEKTDPSPPTTPRRGISSQPPTSAQDIDDIDNLTSQLRSTIKKPKPSPKPSPSSSEEEFHDAPEAPEEFYDPTVQPMGYETTMRGFNRFKSFQTGSPQFLRSFSSPARTALTSLSTPMTLFSVRARVRRPLDRAHIVKLRTILEKTREDKPLHDEMSMQAYGFNYNAWLLAQQQKFPVDSMSGKKQAFGNITTNRRSGVFTFKIVKRTTDKMRKALYDYIDQMFDLSASKVEIKRKGFQLVSGVNSTQDLDEYITAQIKGKRELIFRISW